MAGLLIATFVSLCVAIVASSAAAEGKTMALVDPTPVPGCPAPPMGDVVIHCQSGSITRTYAGLAPQGWTQSETLPCTGVIAGPWLPGGWTVTWTPPPVVAVTQTVVINAGEVTTLSVP